MVLTTNHLVVVPLYFEENQMGSLVLVSIEGYWGAYIQTAVSKVRISAFCCIQYILYYNARFKLYVNSFFYCTVSGKKNRHFLLKKNINELVHVHCTIASLKLIILVAMMRTGWVGHFWHTRTNQWPILVHSKSTQGPKTAISEYKEPLFSCICVCVCLRVFVFVNRPHRI